MEELNLLTALQCSIATQFLTTVRVNLIVCVDGISITLLSAVYYLTGILLNDFWIMFLIV